MGQSDSVWRSLGQLRLERELLLLAASPLRSEARTSRIQHLLRIGPDWRSLEHFALCHRLMPLLYWELKSARPDLISLALADKFQRSTRNCLFLTGELIRVLGIFDREGIPAIPFKGPGLAIAAYNNLSLRSFDDLDILVRPGDVWRARDVLLREGYEASLLLNPNRESAYLRSYDELVFHGPNGYPLLELHWDFVPNHFSVSLDLRRVWEQSTTISLGNRSVPALSPEDMFLVLCLHGAKHCWSHLGLICDVGWFMTAQQIRWDVVLARAREAGIHRITLLAISLARRLFEIPPPEPVERELCGDLPVPVLTEETVAVLFGEGHDENAILRTGLLHMRMRERPIDRVRYFFHLSTRPGVEDWQMLDLPKPLSFFYPLLRYPRLAFKYCARVF